MKLKDLLSFSSKSETCSTHDNQKRDLHAFYTVKEEIGRGGFGVVFAAERRSDGIEVAIKHNITPTR